MRPSNRRSARLSAMVAVLSLALPLSAGAAVAQPGTSEPVAPAGVATVTGAPPVVTAVGSAITFTGHGWGHGRGMGQYGALGYALSGSPYTDILAYYYGNTTASNVGNPEMSVELLSMNGKPLVVVGRQVLVNGVDLGTAARLTLQPGGSLLVERGTGCVSTWTAVAGTFIGNATRVTTSVPPATLDDLLRVCEATGERAYRGELSAVNHQGLQMTINHLPTESYLRGVVPRESPASWGALGGGRGMQALKAQAVAARSYALSSTRDTGAKTCDTTACQVYLGAGFKTSSWLVLEAAPSDQAVAETAGEVRVRAGTTTIARTEFSSSTGGYTAGGTFPAVPDNGDWVSSNPNHNWTAVVATGTVASGLGVAGIRSLTVTGRNGLGAEGGRVTQVTLIDSAGATRTFTGNQVRVAAGLKSDWFTISGAGSAEAEQVVRALYADVLGRGVDPDGLVTWTAYIGRTGDTAGLVRQIATSRERMEKLVTTQYGLALNRAPEPGGLDHWVAWLAAGRGVYDLQVGIYGSPESLLKLGGGDVNLWVGALYERILGRASAASERAFWTDIATRQGREAVVAAIARSDEATMRRLTDYYETFLLRGVDPAGRATFLPLMTGRGDFDIPVALGSSPEYWVRAQTRSF